MIFQEVVNMHLTYETMKLLNLSDNWVVHIIVQKLTDKRLPKIY